MRLIGSVIRHLQRWFARYRTELAQLRPKTVADQLSKSNGIAQWSANSGADHQTLKTRHSAAAPATALTSVSVSVLARSDRPENSPKATPLRGVIEGRPFHVSNRVKVPRT
jgi:hypothetical protein